MVIPEVGKNIGDSWFGEALKKLRAKITGAVDAVAEKLATNTVNAQKAESDAQLAQQLEKMTGVDLRGLMRDEDLSKVVDEAIAANVALIKSIPNQYADKVEALILRGLQEGKRAESIAEDIKTLGGVTDDRVKAELFARLGVLYFADPDTLKSAMQLAYGMYHELFGLSRSTPNSNEYVRSKIWTTAGESAQTHGKHGSDPADVPDDGSGSGQQSASDLGRLRREFARVMKASEKGKKALL